MNGEVEGVAMDEYELRNYLKKQRRSESAIVRVVSFTGRFEGFLEPSGRSLDDALPGDLETFIASDQFKKKQAKTFLWGVSIHFGACSWVQSDPPPDPSPFLKAHIRSVS